MTTPNAGPARFCVITPELVVNSSLITTMRDAGEGDVEIRMAGGEKVTVEDTSLEALAEIINEQVRKQI